MHRGKGHAEDVVNSFYLSFSFFDPSKYLLINCKPKTSVSTYKHACVASSMNEKSFYVDADKIISFCNLHRDDDFSVAGVQELDISCPEETALQQLDARCVRILSNYFPNKIVNLWSVHYFSDIW